MKNNINLIYLILIALSCSTSFSQENDSSSVIKIDSTYSDSSETQILKEIVFSPISKSEIKTIIKKINNSIDKNYKINDSLKMNYNEKSIYNISEKTTQKDTIVKKYIKGSFGIVIPYYNDLTFIPKASILSIDSCSSNVDTLNVQYRNEDEEEEEDEEEDDEKYKNESKDEDIATSFSNFSTPFMVPTMALVTPIATSVKSLPFVDDYSDYKYSGWSDDSTYIVEFVPEDYGEKYMFCGRMVINKSDFAVTNVTYELCSKNNKTNILDAPYVSDLIPLSARLMLKVYLLFNWTIKKVINNTDGNTLLWKTDIGYVKNGDTYSLAYLNVETNSISTINIDPDLAEDLSKKYGKKADKKMKSSKEKELFLKHGMYISSNHRYKLEINVEDYKFDPKGKKYMDTFQYKIYTPILEEKINKKLNKK